MLTLIIVGFFTLFYVIWICIILILEWKFRPFPWGNTYEDSNIVKNTNSLNDEQE